MKWSHLGIFAALLVVLIGLSAQTQPLPVLFSGGTVSAPIKFPDGTATAPSVTFAADTDVGLYRPGANILAVAANNTTLMWLPASGNFATLGASGTFAWAANGDAANTADTGLARSGVASVTVSNSSTGPGSFSTAGTSRALALPIGSIGIATSATSTVGNTGQGARLVLVCGPTSGTSSLLLYSGTSNTPVVLANAVGGGLIGC